MVVWSVMLPITQVSSDLLRWNALGFFATPEDTVESYTARALSWTSQALKENTQEARNVVRSCYDIDPSWVTVIFSKKELFPWEAGCMWYDDKPLIQLHSRFEKKKKYLLFYDRDEILAHEYVHAARSPLHSKSFEEFFAYFVSLQFGRGPLRLLRAFFGPLFEHPREPLLLIIGLLSALLGTFAQMWFFEEISILPIAIALAIATSFFFGRLSLRWYRLYTCKRHFGPQALPLMVRLLDDEIELFSRLSTQEVMAYIHEKRQTNFRWQLLFETYLLQIK